MQIVDIVKPEPKTAQEAFDAWRNYRQSLWLSQPGIGRKIEIEDNLSCNPWRSQRFCQNPDCSWFSHAMAGMAGGDLPEGFVEP